ncbi:MAG: hypothetical protein K0S65_4750 [Labilithrix sp.]|nr:hypothetical protein [Labilithrix sp.]
MRRSPVLVALFLLFASDLGAQVLDDALVPRGLVRFEVSPIFTSWDSRFGRDGQGESEEALGQDLTTSAGHTLFPGIEALQSAIQAMNAATYTPVLGETQARVTADITRVELGGHIGLFDWLTVGAVLPFSRTRTNVDVWFRPDTIAGNLGLNPTVTSAANVSSFLQALGAAETAARTNATQLCASGPGSPACTSAQALAARATGFYTSASSAYGASALFPYGASSTATALSQSVATLSADLVAAGLPGIAPPMPFATERITEPDFWTLPQSAFGYAQPIGSVKAPWAAGDVEVTATVRLLGGDADSSSPPPSFDLGVVASALVRLPTGAIDDPDVLLDIGTGDGQSDLEGRLLAQVTAGRIGLHLGGRYGIQRPRTLVRRVAPPEIVLAPASSRQLVEWEPGAYFALEVAPVWRFTQELSFVGEYRAFRKYRDSYRLVETSSGEPVDTRVLEQESGLTLHEVGGALRYDTLGRLSSGVRPFQAHLRILRAVAGGGGQTPVTTQVELSVRVFRRFWGG